MGKEDHSANNFQDLCMQWKQGIQDPFVYFGRHAGDRILTCWGGRKGLDKEENESGGVVGEACQCISDFGMHQGVKKALVMAMEMKNDRMLDLFRNLLHRRSDH
ncbi:hypothetical protein Dsin_026391 [Dipteronia sinensis]|uniref:Uncharacterized protein n=1 Tax=Dipteronia sinensis TaxID=43782 RepID=A0AAD9ZY83_9ROSI|nr:hypothetical protein Dsin_026391 [Dipteronia sinensis]